MKIPVVYQVIVEKIEVLSFKGRIDTGEVRKTLRKVFRMPRQKITTILKEMQDLDLIKFETEKGGRHILIKKNGE